MTDEEQPPFRVVPGRGEVRVQLTTRTGALADVPDPTAAGAVWHRLTVSEATDLRDALALALEQGSET